MSTKKKKAKASRVKAKAKRMRKELPVLAPSVKVAASNEASNERVAELRAIGKRQMTAPVAFENPYWAPPLNPLPPPAPTPAPLAKKPSAWQRFKNLWS